MISSLCVIPARSGSKGLKDKNILDINGKPVLAYTIEACKMSGLFNNIYVATDSKKYAEIACDFGAEVPFLEPEYMAGDAVPSTDPVIYFYNQLGKDVELLWCMQPTSPLRSVEDIVNAYKIIENNSICEYVLGTTIIDPHYFHWALQDKDNDMAELFFGKEMLVDRSELKDIVHRPNGAIKVGRTNSVLKSRSFFGENIKRIDMPEERSIHIRGIMDYELCKLLLNKEV
ncbi:CMP-N,N'-diacetyllegionaminic acid synthase [Lachnotalea glycerini]|uniref:Acylneuraminate cytidylyltransferase family protein n=1 Tax=Lachnotalea glycerini TaxID=1763509 RepID=A0A255I941_9FIRM|nr:acylneuraminate cytidylyltransferase family protein [Lachnotalea glycerini]PXV91845.1 CMP-N,N'-diacetyllegionaminic acid synthase [Lachnotalea glycerini]RDY27374.1 acylneuraminate cytidylyltransferase family protein [Lachnotalea glycerini]